MAPTPTSSSASRQGLGRLAMVLGLVAVAALVVPAAAHYPCHPYPAYSIQLLVNGRPLPELPWQGTTYVEAIRGAEYSVRITNHTCERIAVALSVDGLSSIDASTGPARRAPKWVLEGNETITVDGWQVDSGTARRFFFTTEEESYGAWLGRTANLGVVEAVVFRERLPRPQPITRFRHDADSPAAAGEKRSRPDIRPPLSDDAATGIGRRVDNPVHRVHFDLDPDPAACLHLRYEYRPRLLRLGVLPYDRDHRYREQERQPPGNGFAPDPDRGP